MENIYEKRISICRECPLFKKQFDGNHRCNGQLYMDPVTKKTSYLPKKGFVKGCNCLMEVKARNPNAKCVADLW